MDNDENISDDYRFDQIQRDEIKEIIFRYCESEIQIENFIKEFEDGIFLYVAELNGTRPLSAKVLIKQVEDLDKTLWKLTNQLSDLDMLNDLLIGQHYIARRKKRIYPEAYEWSDLLSLHLSDISVACTEYLIEKTLLKNALLKEEGSIVSAIKNASQLHCKKIKIKDGTNSTAVKLVQVIKDEFGFQKTAQRVVSQYLKLAKEDNQIVPDIPNENTEVEMDSFKKAQNIFLFRPDIK